MPKMQLKDIIDLINPFQECYRVGIVKETSFRLMYYEGLTKYSEYYIKSITADDQEGYGICLSFILAENPDD